MLGWSHPASTNLNGFQPYVSSLAIKFGISIKAAILL